MQLIKQLGLHSEYNENDQYCKLSKFASAGAVNMFWGHVIYNTSDLCSDVLKNKIFLGRNFSDA
jgi:hypothetical protein